MDASRFCVFVVLVACGHDEPVNAPPVAPVVSASASASQAPITQAPTVSSSSSTFAEPQLFASARCTKDSDCIVSTWGGCCSACPPMPHATSRAEEDALHRRCAVIDCTVSTNTRPCPPVPDASDYRAVCRQETCTLAR